MLPLENLVAPKYIIISNDYKILIPPIASTYNAVYTVKLISPT